MSDDVKVTVGYTKTQETSEINIRKRPDGTYDTATDYRGNDFVFGVEKGNWSFSAGWGDFDSDWNNTTITIFQRFTATLRKTSTSVFPLLMQMK